MPAMEMIGDMRLAPIDSAEALAAEVRIVKADGRPGLGNVAEARKGRVAARPEVLDRETMLAAHARGERDVGARDVVVAASARAADLADEEVARRRIERPAIAEDHAQRDQRLRCRAVVIDRVQGAVDGPDAGVA